MENQLLVYSESQLLLLTVSDGSKYKMVSLFEAFAEVNNNVNKLFFTSLLFFF